jgi:hypothetical protein
MNDNTLETICQSQTAAAAAAAAAAEPSTSIIPTLDPTISCDSMGIRTDEQCIASCNEYFPGSNLASTYFGVFCSCDIQDYNLDTGTIVCGAGGSTLGLNCKQAGVIDSNTCNERCKQATSIPGTTFMGAFDDSQKSCDCLAEVPNYGAFSYCGSDGPPPSPASGVLPSCTLRYINSNGKL